MQIHTFGTMQKKNPIHTDIASLFLKTIHSSPPMKKADVKAGMMQQMSESLTRQFLRFNIDIDWVLFDLVENVTSLLMRTRLYMRARLLQRTHKLRTLMLRI